MCEDCDARRVIGLEMVKLLHRVRAKEMTVQDAEKDLISRYPEQTESIQRTFKTNVLINDILSRLSGVSADDTLIALVVVYGELTKAIKTNPIEASMLFAQKFLDYIASTEDRASTLATFEFPEITDNTVRH